MIKIFLTPKLTENTKELLIIKKTIDERAIGFAPTAKKRFCQFGFEGLDWHTSLGAAKSHLAKCKTQEISWLKEQAFNLKRAPIVVRDL